MAQAPPTTDSIGRRLATEEQKRAYRDLLTSHVNDGWWRHYIKLVEARKKMFTEMLVEGGIATREEDVLRGMIQEASFTLVIDAEGQKMVGEKLQRQKEESRIPIVETTS